MGKPARGRQTKRSSRAVLPCLVLLMLSACGDRPSPPSPPTCAPTPYDEIGPFYRPGAPVRASVGTGYVLSGQVLAAPGCKPLPNSRLEFWLVSPTGEYDDAHRATVYADRTGGYRFESNRPTDYVGRLPHIHLLVTAAGYEQLITQHYPKEGETKAELNLVLTPKP